MGGPPADQHGPQQTKLARALGRARSYFDFSVFVPEQHWPQHAPHAQLVVIVVTTVFATSILRR